MVDFQQEAVTLANDWQLVTEGEQAVREAIKVSCVVFMMVAIGVSFAGWLEERPTPMSWALRIGGLAAAAVAIAIFLVVHVRKDLVPDYLRGLTRSYFNRGGFCFAVQPAKINGVGYLNLYFQNQYERPCMARVVLRPAQTFFLTRLDMQWLSVEIDCGAAAFGVARIPFAIPKPIQGTRQSFEVGASVTYLEGRGRMVRFHDGEVVRDSAEFVNAFGTVLFVTGLLGGQLVRSKPATVTVAVPGGVAEYFTGEIPTHIETLWKSGDAPLQISHNGNNGVLGQDPPQQRQESERAVGRAAGSDVYAIPDDAHHLRHADEENQLLDIRECPNCRVRVQPSADGICPSCRQHRWAMPASAPTAIQVGPLEGVIDIASEAQTKLRLNNEEREREGLKPLDHGEAIASLTKDIQLAVQKAERYVAWLQAKQIHLEDAEAHRAETIRNNVSLVRLADEELNLARSNREERERVARVTLTDVYTIPAGVRISVYAEGSYFRDETNEQEWVLMVGKNLSENPAPCVDAPDKLYFELNQKYQCAVRISDVIVTPYEVWRANQKTNEGGA